MWKNIAKPLDTHTNNMGDQTKPFENKLQSGSGLDGTSLRSMSFCGESAFAQPNGYFNDSAVSAQRLQYKTVQDRLINSTKTNWIEAFRFASCFKAEIRKSEIKNWKRFYFSIISKKIFNMYYSIQKKCCFIHICKQSIGCFTYNFYFKNLFRISSLVREFF